MGNSNNNNNNSEKRTIENIGLIVGGMIFAPLTAGISLAIGGGLAGIRSVADGIVEENCTHYSSINIDIGSMDRNKILDIKAIEIRYCHITNPAGDALLTLLARGLVMTKQAAHHHFIIITLDPGQYIYLDKHSYRNILIRNNKKGKNGSGNDWLESEILKSKSISSSKLTLNDIIQFINNHTSGDYHLLDDNCQHFATKIYNQWQ